jgi:hypothetical protein
MNDAIPVAMPNAAPSNTHNNLVNNRRELPNVPRSSLTNENKPSSTVTAPSPLFNSPMSNNTSTGSTAASRSTPSQWMGNIGQTIRRQTSNAVDVRIRALFVVRCRLNFVY